MGWMTKLRRGEGPVWGRLKRLAKAVQAIHIPVNGMTRPVARLSYRFHVFVRESWVWGRRFFWNEPLFRSQCESIGTDFRMEELPYMGGTGRIVIGDRVVLSGWISIGFSNQIVDRPEFVVGDGTFIGHRVGFNIGRSIHIGSHCYIASGCSITDMDGHPVDAADRRAGKPTPPEGCKPIVIGDDVWVGFHVLILKGVTIGPRSIIAAGSVVTRDIPPDSVVAGNPARVVKQLAVSSTSETPAEDNEAPTDIPA
jgi:acetyltransferase-like isoleucine patch superfamily enzyme